ncbi:hypothetical protein KSP39_PZI016501 [Platanthera zijinensis]|uniref:Uncharacterized protein n=1 Tax=Platanthera zijinensis TaxID=2320716 RepID=A0AAP0G152_9ASPA
MAKFSEPRWKRSGLGGVAGFTESWRERSVVIAPSNDLCRRMTLLRFDHLDHNFVKMRCPEAEAATGGGRRRRRRPTTARVADGCGGDLCRHAHALGRVARSPVRESAPRGRERTARQRERPCCTQARCGRSACGLVACAAPTSRARPLS